MSADQLRQWLALPPGPWPPDHYTLLGLPPGGGTADEIEARVLARMARLRERQLVHPDAVTDGMNRLAQALVCLTDAASRAAYDAELGVGPPARPAPQVFAFASTLQPPPPAPLPPAPPPPLDVEPPPAAAVAAAADRSAKRETYARLAATRRLMRAWDRARPALADPGDPVDGREAARALGDAFAAIRDAVDGRDGDVVGRPDRPGGLVVSLARRPLAAEKVREMPSDQRQAVAADWVRGRRELDREYARLRGLTGSWASKREARGWVAWAVRGVGRHPEVAAAVTLAAAVMAAAGRAVVGR